MRCHCRLYDDNNWDRRPPGEPIEDEDGDWEFGNMFTGPRAGGFEAGPAIFRVPNFIHVGRHGRGQPAFPGTMGWSEPAFIGSGDAPARPLGHRVGLRDPLGGRGMRAPVPTLPPVPAPFNGFGGGRQGPRMGHNNFFLF